MLIISLIIMFISINLDGIISTYISFPSIFISNFTLISFLMLFPLLKEKKDKLYLFILVFTIYYDFLYNSILFYNTFIYIILYYILNRFYKNFNILYLIISIFLYNVLNYLLFFIIGYRYSLLYLLHIIYSSMILNIAYSFILYLFFRNKYYVKKYINVNKNRSYLPWKG